MANEKIKQSQQDEKSTGEKQSQGVTSNDADKEKEPVQPPPGQEPPIGPSTQRRVPKVGRRSLLALGALGATIALGLSAEIYNKIVHNVVHSPSPLPSTHTARPTSPVSQISTPTNRPTSPASPTSASTSNPTSPVLPTSAIASIQPIGTIPAYGQVHSVAWSPDRQYIAVGGWGGTQVWKWNTSQAPYSSYPNHIGNTIYGVAWSPNGKYVATASSDHTVQVWEVLPGSQTPFITYQEHNAEVYAVAWSHDGKYIVSGGDDNMVHVWKVNYK